MDTDVIGHRGASGYRPEHTLAAFELALDQGADGIEVDVVMTRDGVPLVRHDRELSRTTDVAEQPHLRSLRRTRMIHGLPVSGWFAEDLTWAQVSGLRARERWPERRPTSAAFTGAGVLRLADVLDLVERRRVRGRCRLLVELKDTERLAAIGLPVEDVVVDLLGEHGFSERDSDVAVMSFHAPALRRLSGRTGLELVQLVDAVNRVRLREVAEYADSVGLGLDLLSGRGRRRGLVDPRPIEKAHRRGLTPYVWTLRAENRSLPQELRRGRRPYVEGDLGGYAGLLIEAGARGLITDHPDVVVAAREARRLPLAA